MKASRQNIQQMNLNEIRVNRGALLMPYPRYQKQRKKTYYPKLVHNELEFSEELAQSNVELNHMQPLPQPKDYDEIEY